MSYQRKETFSQENRMANYKKRENKTITFETNILKGFKGLKGAKGIKK